MQTLIGGKSVSILVSFHLDTEWHAFFATVFFGSEFSANAINLKYIKNI